MALRQGRRSKTSIALDAKLDLPRAGQALEKLEALGLASRTETNRWLLTRRGSDRNFKTVPDRFRPYNVALGRGTKRLLALLHRPLRGSELVNKSGITRQGVHQLLVKLHAQGRVKLGDRSNAMLIVARSGDKTPLLRTDEERVLSAIPESYPTSLMRLKRAVQHISKQRLQEILARFLKLGFIAPFAGISGDTVYRITAATLKHPQRRQARRAVPLRLPVESDRPHAMLSVIEASGSLRSRDLVRAMKLPAALTYALAHRLKQRGLVQSLDRNWSLTDKGVEVLAELTRRRSAREPL
jgi:DNA-binding IclR family transcriptional regulator